MWKVIAHSVMGTSHQKIELPCQDSGDYLIIDNILIGAVSDGAGSAKFSQIGSNLAVKKTLLYLKAWLNWIQENQPERDFTQPISETEAEQLFLQTLEKVIDRLKKETEKGYSFKDLSCTLLAFIATPHWLSAMQIGDGFIVVRSEQFQYELLFPPTKGEYANETIFVTSRNALSELQCCVINEPIKFICASTDGLEKLAITFNKDGYIPHYPFFEAFEEGIVKNNYQEESDSILDWLDSEKVNARTDDDKTILVCLNDTISVKANQIHKPIKPIDPKLAPSKNNLLLPIPLTLLIQIVILGIIGGLLFGYNWNLFNLIELNTPNSTVNLEPLLLHSYLVLIVFVVLAILFTYFTYSILQKSLKSKIYAFFMSLLALMIGLSIGWGFYFLIYGFTLNQ